MLTQLALWQATLRTWLADRARFGETGASMVEYSLLLALIAVVAIVALVFLGHGVSNTLNSVGSNVANP